MLELRDLMTPDPVTLGPEMTLREAIEQLMAAGVTGAPVVSSEWLVGVVSASDILEFQATSPGVPSYREEQQEWGEWGPADTWEGDMSDPPSAYFTELWADSGADLTQRMAESDGPEWDRLSEQIVGEVMTRKVVALPPEADVTEAARLMVETQVRRVIVAEGHALQGVVSAMDFVRAVAEGKLRPSS
jgi:CBS domain-containing protein